MWPGVSTRQARRRASRPCWRAAVAHDSAFSVMCTTNTTLLPTTAASYASVEYGAGGVVQSYNSTGAGGADRNYCAIAEPWFGVGTMADILVHVVCFDPTGNPAPDGAFVTGTNRR